LKFLVYKEVQTFPLISIFNLMCESSMVLRKSWNWIISMFVVFDIVFRITDFGYEKNHEYGVFMDYR